jgi:hypothetical protein
MERTDCKTRHATLRWMGPLCLKRGSSLSIPVYAISAITFGPLISSPTTPDFQFTRNGVVPVRVSFAMAMSIDAGYTRRGSDARVRDEYQRTLIAMSERCERR